MTQSSRLDRAIVVTGASTGIGHAAVASAVANGGHAFASVRKEADAQKLKDAFGDHVTPLLFDVTNEVGVNAGAASVGAALGKRKLFGLVNNAGIAVAGPLLHLETEDIARQLEINVLGVHRVTRAFAPLLGADPDRTGKPGRIVMISSVAGQFGQPFVGAYAASKHALEGYAQSLRRELQLYGIDVVIVGPGAIATPIWDKADESELERFDNTAYAPMLERVKKYFVNSGKNGLPASQVGDLIWRILNDDKPKVRYAILRRPFMDRLLPMLLPPRFVDKQVAKRLGFPNAA